MNIPFKSIEKRLKQLEKACQEESMKINYDKQATINDYIRALASYNAVLSLVNEFRRGKL